jgi:hypothetical protein
VRGSSFKERKEPAMIKGSLIVVICVLLTAPFAYAQKTEAFVGYTNLQSEGLPETNSPSFEPFDFRFFQERTTLHGINGSFTGYVSEGFGLTGDVSWARRGHNGVFSGVEQSRHVDTTYFVGGPSVKFGRGTRWQPFTRVMAGVAHTSFEARSSTPVSGGTATSSFDVGSNDFTASVGGGIDLRLGENTKLRLFQVDWMPIFLSDRSIDVLGSNGVIQPTTFSSQRQDNWRFSIGLVF